MRFHRHRWLPHPEYGPERLPGGKDYEGLNGLWFKHGDREGGVRFCTRCGRIEHRVFSRKWGLPYYLSSAYASMPYRGRRGW